MRAPAALSLISPNWPAPASVRAHTTTRQGGSSGGGYATLNLADHVGDDPACVQRNRELLRHALGLPTDPIWLRQEHGIRVIDAAVAMQNATADGAFTAQQDCVCAVLTADCVPILLCDRAGTRVAALHGGWRGLLDGIIDKGVAALRIAPEELLAWIGPAIGAASYTVRDDLHQRFITTDAANERFFTTVDGLLTFDLESYCAARLVASGVPSIYRSDCCVYREPERFFSYRREPVTGRMASLIWLQRRT